LQGAELFTVSHRPVVALHESSVHPFRSLQSFGEPAAQRPAAQVSFSVHGSPSLQDAALFVDTHPPGDTQVSSVQSFPSSQPGGTLPMQSLFAQTSTVVQASSSLHGAVFGAFTHPLPGSQESSVQTLPSRQSIGAPAQLPPSQASPVVHALPSSQGSPLSTWTQPVSGLQLSSVQPLPSSQLTGSLTHAWAMQRSFVVH
jgi:hypothetical protein